MWWAFRNGNRSCTFCASNADFPFGVFRVGFTFDIDGLFIFLITLKYVARGCSILHESWIIWQQTPLLCERTQSAGLRNWTVQLCLEAGGFVKPNCEHKAWVCWASFAVQATGGVTWGQGALTVKPPSPDDVLVLDTAWGRLTRSFTASGISMVFYGFPIRSDNLFPDSFFPCGHQSLFLHFKMRKSK